MKHNFLMLAYKSNENKSLYGGIDNCSNSYLLLIEFKNTYKSNFFYRVIATKKTDCLIPSKIKRKLLPVVMKRPVKVLYEYFDEVLKDELKKCFVAENTCFIIAARVFEYFGEPILHYIRNMYGNIKFVTYLTDVLDSFYVTKEELKKNFDMVFTFDKSESRKYGFTYVLEPYTFSADFLIESKPLYDVTFIGAAKDRYDDIVSVYEKLRQKKLKLDFYIFGVKEDKQKYKDEIHYNEYLSFEDFIKHTLNAKCTFEVLQKKGSSPTTRFSICMLYKRKLLTNCAELLEPEWVDTIKTGNIQVYTDIDKIDIDWINQSCDYNNQKYIEMFSTDRMLEAIDSYL